MARGKARRQKGTKPALHRKVPGFDAFSSDPQSMTKKKKVRRRKGFKKRKIQMVDCEKLIERETGIHSFSWAAAIVPQSCSFLRLPFEIRMLIYEKVIAQSSFSTGLQPLKSGKKFRSPPCKNVSEETASLYLLCRQAYVDVYGSGLLYRHTPFIFNSQTLMLNYLCVINPIHKDAIRTVSLKLKLSSGRANLPSKPLKYLRECKGLRCLTLIVDVASELCEKLTGLNWGAWVSKYRIKDKVIENIKECMTLRDLKGLQSFHLRFEISKGSRDEDYYSRQLVDPASEEKSRWRKLELEMRKILVVEV